MATVLLSAAGAAIGSGFGGTVLGLSGAVIGRAAGAAIGQSIDQRVLGTGSEAVPTGKVDRFRISAVGYGTPINEVWGRMRVAGEIIWASRFMENRQISGGGKGSPRPVTETFSYSVSIAIALCRGEALRVGRIWADGVEIALNTLDFRFYPGTDDQMPDAKIEAVEGIGFAPSYRGICYVVIENLPLSRFGNRVPQFSFEVVRRAAPSTAQAQFDLPSSIYATALIPGSGEYALATTPVHYNFGIGDNRSANVHSIQDVTDTVASLRQLDEELPNCGAVSLVVSWFGDDLRCNHCAVQPKVEQSGPDGVEMPWIVSSVNRTSALTIRQVDERPVYGGTPSDQSVIEAIVAIRDSGKEVMFYPFILMDQAEQNGLPDPWSTNSDQPVLPWRGRITLSRAPGQPGTPDMTAAAEAEVAAFLGSSTPEQFARVSGEVVYSGPQEWSYRRFILHYANLCVLAGGVDAFCIGSELRGLTQIRSSMTTFPMVDALKALAAEVKSILGTQTRVSYAADWSEYFGYHTDSSVYFHLDSLWSDTNIDFVGIDNYMPISDWRDEKPNLDIAWGSIYNPEYLMANIAGGEGFDWYYDSPEGELVQRRVPIADTAHGEDWVFRFKDIRSWWSNAHHDRLNGVRSSTSTSWVPQSKPIVFTEYGCAALDKATNQPNRFLDTKSSESALPRASNGQRDDFIQMQYYSAQRKYWTNDENNPASFVYSGAMVDMDRSHAWAWDARPFPDFPGNVTAWSDGTNYLKGHWLNGRSSGQPIASVVAEISSEFGLSDDIDVSDVWGLTRGFQSSTTDTFREKIQSILLGYGIDIREKEGVLEFASRSNHAEPVLIATSDLVAQSEGASAFSVIRSAYSESFGRAKLTYIEAENDFNLKTVEAQLDESRHASSASDLKIQFTDAEAGAIVERWLAEASITREVVRFSLAQSYLRLSGADVIEIEGDCYRVDRIDGSGVLAIDASRIDKRGSRPSVGRSELLVRMENVASTPVSFAFLDLPLLSGNESPQSPHIAVSSVRWPGPVGVWSSTSEVGFNLSSIVEVPAVMGAIMSDIALAPSTAWDLGSVIRVQLSVGSLSSASTLDVLNGANVCAVGDGSSDDWEIIQFSKAVTIGPNLFELSILLRGLAGTGAIAPHVWPAGSLFVLLDNLLPQVEVPLSVRGLTRNYRIGELEKGYSHLNVENISRAFVGIGLRPYSVAHLDFIERSDGSIEFKWIRRTRIDGDNWQSFEVPLGEESLSFEVVVMKGIQTLRREIVSLSNWLYTSAMQAADDMIRPFDVSVAQISSTYGPGPSATVVVE